MRAETLEIPTWRTFKPAAWSAKTPARFFRPPPLGMCRRAGEGDAAGGLTSNNGAFNNFNCNGCIPGDGAAYFNTATISDSHATGNVTVGAMSVAGGVAGSGDGTFTHNSPTRA